MPKSYRKSYRKAFRPLFCHRSLRHSQETITICFIVSCRARKKSKNRQNLSSIRFFGMKNELLYLHKWDSMKQFKAALREYVDYYNNKRIKLRLNGLSPIQYRTQNM